jgi:hypothetical protein
MISVADPDFKPYFYDEASGDGLVVTGEKFQLLRRVIVQEATAGAAITITNGSGGTLILTIPASTAVGTIYDLGDVQCVDGVYFNENSATAGQFTFVIKKYIKGA